MRERGKNIKRKNFEPPGGGGDRTSGDNHFKILHHCEKQIITFAPPPPPALRGVRLTHGLVGTAVVGGNKAEPLRSVEPFDGRGVDAIQPDQLCGVSDRTKTGALWVGDVDMIKEKIFPKET